MSEKLSILFSYPNLPEYIAEVYPTLRSSDVCKDHDIILTHENSNEPFDSPTYLKNNPRAILIADVTRKRFGVGTEVGMAVALERPVFALIQKDNPLSRSAQYLATQVY